MINKVQGVLEKNYMIFCIARLNQYFFNIHTCAQKNDLDALRSAKSSLGKEIPLREVWTGAID